ncbi:MAG: MFS transporter [Oscillospiraceae bacterium]
MKKIDLKNATTREILMFSLLPFGLLTIINVIGNALNVYLADYLGIGMVGAGLVLSITKIWDAVNDPMMGLIVDKTRTKWGKCRPYLLWMVIPMMVGTVLLFAPVDFKNSSTFAISQIDMASTFATIGNNFHIIRTSSDVNTGNFWYAVFAYLVFYTFYTAVDIPYQGLTPLAFPDSKTRVKAISVSNIFGSIGTILPSIIFFPIVYGFEDKRIGFFVASIVFAVLAGIPIFISFFGVKEKVYIKPKPIKYKKSLKIIFANKNMKTLIWVALFSAITNLGSMFLMFFAKWNCYGIFNFPALNQWFADTLNFNPNFTEEGLLFPILSISSGISYMLSMAIVPPLLKKMDKKTLFIRMSLICAVMNVIVFIICMYVFPYTSTDLTTARIGFVAYCLLRFFTNFPVGMSLVLLTAIFSDTIDVIEMESGERLEGAVFSFRSLVNKIGIAGFNLIVMVIVNAFGYTAMSTQLTALKDAGTLTRDILLTNHLPALNAIFFMLTILGSIGLVLQALPMYKYRFNEDEYEDKIKAFREEKEAELEAEMEESKANA